MGSKAGRSHVVKFYSEDIRGNRGSCQYSV
jgi:hypothetical protein